MSSTSYKLLLLNSFVDETKLFLQEERLDSSNSHVILLKTLTYQMIVIKEERKEKLIIIRSKLVEKFIQTLTWIKIKNQTLQPMSNKGCFSMSSTSYKLLLLNSFVDETKLFLQEERLDSSNSHVILLKTLTYQMIVIKEERKEKLIIIRSKLVEKFIQTLTWIRILVV